MSPQMNGEQRDGGLDTSDHAGAAIRPPSAMHEADRPMLEATNNDAVIKTTVKEHTQTTPLFTQDVATDFRSRWDAVQRSFVDSPQDAVRAGDQLVLEVIKSLTDTFARQRSQLEGELSQTDLASTENLRLALRSYRSFFERLLAI